MRFLVIVFFSLSMALLAEPKVIVDTYEAIDELKAKMTALKNSIQSDIDSRKTDEGPLIKGLVEMQKNVLGLDTKVGAYVKSTDTDGSKLKALEKEYKNCEDERKQEVDKIIEIELYYKDLLVLDKTIKAKKDGTTAVVATMNKKQQDYLKPFVEAAEKRLSNLQAEIKRITQVKTTVKKDVGKALVTAFKTVYTNIESVMNAEIEKAKKISL